MVGAVNQSAKGLSNLLVSFATSHCYPQLQLLKAKLLKDSHAVLPSEQSNESVSRAVEAEAEAVAADWVCLLWLLQKAPADVATLHEVCCRHRLHKTSLVHVVMQPLCQYCFARGSRVNIVPEMAVVKHPWLKFSACDTSTLHASANYVLTF